MTIRSVLLAALTSSMLMVLGGCSSSDSSPSSATPVATDTEQADHDHAAHDGSGTKQAPEASAAEMDKITEAMASLSDEDRASATKQRLCPVSGEPLGTMGAPEKVDVDGRPVWICCDGCRERLLADPEKYLAKITE